MRFSLGRIFNRAVRRAVFRGVIKPFFPKDYLKYISHSGGATYQYKCHSTRKEVREFFQRGEMERKKAKGKPYWDSKLGCYSDEVKDGKYCPKRQTNKVENSWNGHYKGVPPAKKPNGGLRGSCASNWK